MFRRLKDRFIIRDFIIRVIQSLKTFEDWEIHLPTVIHSAEQAQIWKHFHFRHDKCQIKLILLYRGELRFLRINSGRVKIYTNNKEGKE